MQAINVVTLALVAAFAFTLGMVVAQTELLRAPLFVAPQDARQTGERVASPAPASAATFKQPLWTPADVEPTFNPLEPVIGRVQHPVFKQFRRWNGPFDPAFLTDWLGVRTTMAWDCVDDPSRGYRYGLVVPSRRIPCEAHLRRIKAGTAVVEGYMPLVDDEYEEYTDMLEAVASTKDDFVVVEFGARYGTWGARALAAWRNLHGWSKRSRFVGVEADALFVQWMKTHLQANNMTQQSTVIHAFASPTSVEKDVPFLSLPAFFEQTQLDHVNYMDLDIQGSELDFLSSEAALKLLEERVDIVHIGTHGGKVHNALVDVFKNRGGWDVRVSFQPGGACDASVVNSLQTDRNCMASTDFGPVYIRDGLLSLHNVKRVGRYSKAKLL